MTIKEIAKAANVSIGTVDRVLNNRNGVSQKTKATIERIIEESGYKRNAYASNLKLGTSMKIGLLIPNLDSEFGYWGQVYSGIEKAINELSSFGVSVYPFFFDRDKENAFLEAFDKLRSHDCDAYLLSPLPLKDVTALQLKDIDKPIVFIDSAFPSFKPAFVIAQNPYRGGYTAAKMMKLITRETGTFLVFQIHPDAYNSFERARGFKENMQQDSRNTIVYIDVKSLDDIDQALEDSFLRYKDIKGIFCVNCIVNRIGNYLVQNRLKDKVIAIGFDLVEENAEALRNGSIDCIISQRPAYQGYMAISQLYRYMISKTDWTAKIEIPIDIYFKENIPESREEDLL